jgi:hypothetical protein
VRRPTATLLTLAIIALAGCGDGDDDERASRPAPTEPPQERTAPTATTGEPPGAKRGPPPKEEVPEDEPGVDEQGNPELRPVGRAFRCRGARQRVLSASGPIAVDPLVVRPRSP